MQSTLSVTRLQMNSYRRAGGTQAANYAALYITLAERKRLLFHPLLFINIHTVLYKLEGKIYAVKRWLCHFFFFFFLLLLLRISATLRSISPGNRAYITESRR